MKWDGKKKSIDRDEVLERNLSKIINAKANKVYVFFPYNQKDLLVPNYGLWFEMIKNMSTHDFLICSPNALVKAFPCIPKRRHLITVNEMVLKYWEEIRRYLEANPKIKNIMIVSSDINIARIRRDFSIVFKEHEHEYNIKTKIIVVSPSFWKTAYKIRELIVFRLPIWLYKLLGSFS